MSDEMTVGLTLLIAWAIAAAIVWIRLPFVY